MLTLPTRTCAYYECRNQNSAFRCACKNADFYCSLECYHSDDDRHCENCTTALESVTPSIDAFNLENGLLVTPSGYCSACTSAADSFTKLARAYNNNCAYNDAAIASWRAVHLRLVAVGFMDSSLINNHDEESISSSIEGR
jgi:thiol-disulfide isomerase/thioredoxin